MKYYFDYAAATPMSDKVLGVIKPYFQNLFYNPSAVYLDAQNVSSKISEARNDVAKILGVKASEIIFTAGGTESDNLAIQGVMSAFPGANCVISAVEHDAVTGPAKQFDHKIAPVDKSGLVNLPELENSIDENTVLVSVMYVNNEIGTIQPISEIARLISKIRSKRTKSGNSLPLYLHTDACQAANYLKLLVNSLGVDLMTLNGGKIYGPKQSGVLYIKTGVKLSPQILGGGQERGLRSGTENVPSIIGFAAALNEAQSMRESEFKRLSALRDQLIAQLEAKIKGVVINGTKTQRVANNIHITIPGQDNERLMMALDEAGIMVATGSACSASADEPSHVLMAIGLKHKDARSSIRITLGRQTNEKSIKTLAQTLSSLVAS